MRGPGQSPPKYRKHKPSGQAVVTLDAKDFYLGPHGTKTSKREYDRLVGIWQANGRRLPVEKDRVISVTELCAEYWLFAKTYYVKNGKPTNELTGIKSALRILEKLYGNLPVDQFGPIALASLQNAFIAEGHCRRYINQNIGRIRRMFKWGVSRELVPVAVHQALATLAGLRKGKTAARESAPVLPVPDDVVDETLAHLRNKTTADMVRLQRLLGCRPGEMFIMRPRDIERNNPDYPGVWLYRPESHKMEHKDRHRVILIGPRAQAILAGYLLRAEDQYCFLRRNGKPYTRDSYNKQIHRACDKAFPAPEGTPDTELADWQNRHRWAPNRLRHTAATEIRKEFGLEAAQVVAGHKQADVTQIYAERDIAKAAKIMARVG